MLGLTLEPARELCPRSQAAVAAVAAEAAPVLGPQELGPQGWGCDGEAWHATPTGHRTVAWVKGLGLAIYKGLLTVV